MRGAERETSVLSAAVVKFHYPLLKEPHIIQVRAGEGPTQPGWESSGFFKIEKVFSQVLADGAKEEPKAMRMTACETWWLICGNDEERLMAYRSGEMGRLMEGNVRQPLRNADIQKQHRHYGSSHKGLLTASDSGFYESDFHVFWSFTGFTVVHWEEVETLFMALHVNGQLLLHARTRARTQLMELCH